MSDNQFNHFIDPYTSVSEKLFFNWNIYAYGESGTLLRLEFIQADGSRQYLADRVMPGQTLEDAIKSSLEKDFDIHEWKFIKATDFSDNAQDNQGRPVQRVNVYVEVPYFKITNQSVLGMRLHWFGADLKDEEKATEGVQSLDSQFIKELRSGEQKNITELWTVFTAWLSIAVPEQYGKLNPPATGAELETFAQATGYDLPENAKQLYGINNGGVTGTDINGILSLEFLPIADVISEWRVWREVEDDNLYPSSSYPTYPDEAIKSTYTNAKWIPLLRDGGGNNIGIDLDPGETGTVGQIINFGRDEEKQFVIAESLEGFLRLILLQIADGNVAISKDLDGTWGIGDKDWHLTDELREIIVPKEFYSTTGLKVQAGSIDIIGLFYFDKYENERLVQSSTVRVERLGNDISVQTGNPEIERVFKEIIKDVDSAGSVDQYHEQLLSRLPDEIDGLRLRR